MASFNKFNCFVENLSEKVHNLGSDTLKLMLTNTSPNAADITFDDTTDHRLEATSNAAEITAQNGYTAGGTAITITDSSQTGGTYKLTGNDVVFTASGGSFGPFQYVAMYNASGGSAGTRPAIGWWNYGSSISLNTGETFTVDLDQTNGILTLA